MNEEIIHDNVEMKAFEMLRNARTTGRRKREIPTIAKQLCIREEYLQALEDGNYTFIPEVVYILGFARNYAMELGLDADMIVDKIKSEMGLSPNYQVADVDNIDISKSAPRRDGASRWSFIGLSIAFVRRNWVWFTAGAVVIAIIILLAIMSGGKSDAPAVTDENGEIVVTSMAAEPKYNLPVRERFETKNRDNAKIIIQATQESWVKIEDGRGNTVFSRVLVPGDVFYMPNGENYKGTFGNAGGVDIWVNGKLAPRVGADHTRKNAVPMDVESLMKDAAADTPEETDEQ